MQIHDCLPARVCRACGRPSVGDLMALCEENFLRMDRLAPGLRDCRGLLVSRVQGALDLHLTVEEQSRYTTLARLTYFFDDGERSGGGAPRGADPDALLRVYHDARQVEVLDLRQTALPRYADYRHPALESKWRLNLFLSKWLAYCLKEGHRFGGGRAGASLPEDGGLLLRLT